MTAQVSRSKKVCGPAVDIVLDKLEKLDSVEEELIGGTLEEEKNHFEARLIARALERHNGSVTRAARELGLTHQGLAKIIDGRQSKHSQELDDQKEIAANPLCPGLLRQCLRGVNS